MLTVFESGSRFRTAAFLAPDEKCPEHTEETELPGGRRSNGTRTGAIRTFPNSPSPFSAIR
jgi:hypothetical protein